MSDFYDDYQSSKVHSEQMNRWEAANRQKAGSPLLSLLLIAVLILGSIVILSKVL